MSPRVVKKDNPLQPLYGPDFFRGDLNLLLASHLSTVYCILSAREHPGAGDIPPEGTGSVAGLHRSEFSGWSPAPTM